MAPACAAARSLGVRRERERQPRGWSVYAARGALCGPGSTRGVVVLLLLLQLLLVQVFVVIGVAGAHLSFSPSAALNSHGASDGTLAADSDISIARNSAGTLVATWTATNVGGTGAAADAFFARSVDNGATWTAAQPVQVSGDVVSGTRVCASGTRFLVVWDAFVSGASGHRTTLALSTDGGLSFGTPGQYTNEGLTDVDCSGMGGGVSGLPNFAIFSSSPSSHLIVNLDGVNPTATIVTLVDGGALFQMADPALSCRPNSNACYAAVVSTSQNASLGTDRDLILLPIDFTIRNDPQYFITWPTRAEVDTVSTEEHPAVHASPTFTLVIWSSTDDYRSSGSDYDIWAMRDTARDPVLVNSDGASDSFVDRCPCEVEEDAAGTLVATWTRDGSTVYAHSTDDGATWSAPAPVGADVTSAHTHPVVAPAGLSAGQWVVAWVANDAIGSDLDIFRSYAPWTDPTTGTTATTGTTGTTGTTATTATTGTTGTTGAITTGSPPPPPPPPPSLGTTTAVAQLSTGRTVAVPSPPQQSADQSASSSSPEALPWWIFLVAALACCCCCILVVLAFLLVRRRQQRGGKSGAVPSSDADLSLEAGYELDAPSGMATVRDTGTPPAQALPENQYNSFNAATESLVSESAGSPYCRIPPSFLTDQAGGDGKVIADVVTTLTPDEVLFDPETDMLGRGEYGVVFKGFVRGDVVAVKALPTEAVTPAQLKAFVGEVAVSEALPQHPGLVGFIGATQDPFFLVVEYCPGGDLQSWFEKRVQAGSAPVPPDIKLKFLTQVAQGCLCLAMNGVIHRDLAIRNILISYTDGATAARDPSDDSALPLIQCKVADFGLSRISQSLDNVVHSKAETGPLKWMAPESIRRSIYSEKSDVFALGVVAYEIFSDGGEPWPGESAVAAATKVIKGAHLEFVGMPDALAADLAVCFAFEPEHRPVMSQIVEILEGHAA